MAETKLLSKIRKLPDNRECACCGVKSASPLGFMQVCPKVRLAAVSGRKEAAPRRSLRVV